MEKQILYIELGTVALYCQFLKQAYVEFPAPAMYIGNVISLPIQKFCDTVLYLWNSQGTMKITPFVLPTVGPKASSQNERAYYIKCSIFFTKRFQAVCVCCLRFDVCIRIKFEYLNRNSFAT